MTPLPPSPPANVVDRLRQAGFVVDELAGGAAVRGVPTQSPVFRAPLPGFDSPLLDWAPDWVAAYPRQADILTFEDGLTTVLLPQVCLWSRNDAEGGDATFEVEQLPAVFGMPGEANDPVLRGIEVRRGGATFKNLRWARLAQWDRERRRITVQPGSYFSWLLTNLSADLRPINGGAPLRNRDASGALVDLKDSEFGNVLGINVLLFTGDGALILQRRGDTALVRPREVASAVSATVPLGDLPNGACDLDRLEAARSGILGLGVREEEIRGIRALGITRELVRAGTPDVFYAAHVACRADDLLQRTQRVGDGELFQVSLPTTNRPPLGHANQADQLHLPDILWTVLRHCTNENPASVPLLTNLVLWLADRTSTAARRVDAARLQERFDVAPGAIRRWRRVRLKDFSVFEDAVIEFGPRLNVVLAPNASGKTQLLRLLYAFDVHSEERKLSLDDALRRSFQVGRGGAWPLIRSGASEALVELDVVAGDAEHHAEVRFAAERVQRTGGVDGDGLWSVLVPATDVLALDRIYGGLTRIDGAVDLGTEHLLDQVHFLLRSSVPREPGYLTPILRHTGGRQLKREAGSAPLEFGAPGAGPGASLPITQTADGWRRLGILHYLAAHVLKPGRSRLYWDEPDVHLHPELLPMVADVLIGMAQEDIQVVIATHSYDLVQYLDDRWPERNDADLRFVALFRDVAEGPVDARSGARPADVPNELLRARFELAASAADARRRRSKRQ